jgi:hypothetical protein
MSKQATRQETERLVKEALERKSITIKQGKTRIKSKCIKCGALNRISGCRTRVRNVAKNKGHSELDFGQFRQRPGERILQGKRIRRGILSLSRLCRDSKEIDATHISRLERPLTH